MRRTTSKQSYPCVFCATGTQKGIIHTDSGPVVSVCVKCLRGLPAVAQDSAYWKQDVETDDLICEHRFAVENDSERCQNAAVYVLFHENCGGGSDRTAFCCADGKHLIAFSDRYGDSAKFIPYADAPDPDTGPLRSLRIGQEREGPDADARIGIGRICISRISDALVRVRMLRLSPAAIAQGLVPGAEGPWMKPEAVVAVWPNITKEGGR